MKVNHEIKKRNIFQYLGSKIVTNGRVEEEIIEKLRMQENFNH
jgi:hypothetical protein